MGRAGEARVIDLGHPLVQAADWAVAGVLIAGGVVAWRWSRATSVLLVATGTAWVIGGLLMPALFWHRALLVHLLLAYPGHRPVSRPAWVVVVTTYAVTVAVPAALLIEVVNLTLGLTVPASAAWNLRGATGLTRHRRGVALVAAGVLGAAVVGGSVLRLAAPVDLSVLTLLLYEAGVVATVAVVLSGLRPPAATALTDLVIDLDETRSTLLREALSRTLRDPDLRMGFWDPEAGAHLDDAGRRIEEDLDPSRTPVRIERDGEPQALLLLDRDLARDPRVIGSIRAATRMTALNARREAGVRRQVRDLVASRRRLLAVADDERRRLERELRTGVVRRLERLARELRRLEAGGSSHLERARLHLDGTLDDLAEVAAGLRPRELVDGLEAALGALAERSPVEVEVRGADTGHDLPPEVELTVWYVCAEALSNIAKHAPGARAGISVVRSDGVLRVRVDDDGPGGATLHERGGLVGLQDRVESLGGRLELREGQPVGTVLVAELPWGRRAE